MDNVNDGFDSLIQMPPPALSPRQDAAAFDQKVRELQDWFMALELSGPTEFLFTMSVTDDTTRAWSIRPIGSHEFLDGAVPHHRVIVECTDLWCEKVVRSQSSTVMPPVSVSDLDSLDWTTALPAVAQVLQLLAADVRVDYMTELFDRIGFDAERFLEETELSMSAVERSSFIDAMIYMAYCHDVLNTPEERANLHPLVLPLFETMYAQLRADMFEMWEQNATFRTAEVEG